MATHDSAAECVVAVNIGKKAVFDLPGVPDFGALGQLGARAGFEICMILPLQPWQVEKIDAPVPIQVH
jgi:hypothetical protein